LPEQESGPRSPRNESEALLRRLMKKPGRPTYVYDLGDISVTADQLRILAAFAWEGPKKYYRLTEDMKGKMRRSYLAVDGLEKMGMLRKIPGPGIPKAPIIGLTTKGFARLVVAFQFAERSYLPKKIAIDLKSKEGVRRFFAEGKSARIFAPKTCSKLNLIEDVRWGTEWRSEWPHPLYQQILQCFAEYGTNGEKPNFDWDEAIFRRLASYLNVIARGDPDLLDPFLADKDFREYLLQDHERRGENDKKISEKYAMIRAGRKPFL
jgi:hypothetical protein